MPYFIECATVSKHASSLLHRVRILGGKNCKPSIMKKYSAGRGCECLGERKRMKHDGSYVKICKTIVNNDIIFVI